ncbi:ATP-binding protein [Helicobacter sp. 13S00401-1]|uniref:argininosuccinate synthase domain-containing protein n=1 Tax=Helicobacter sp. 13S00401-1 TaxID=1905758 RepID=UPI000BA71D3F|nr:argininosuccinate synthase domain-containing protein [Helicobacter sp. 13S00401-1]PAF50344.1 ATP-binding protein [Helicobacter sp. 13S00401-1]
MSAKEAVKENKKIKAVALFSGGLDSMIAMKLLSEQGIEVYALNFNIGFGSNKDKSEYFKNASAQVGAKFVPVDIKKQFFDEVLFKPKYGYGRFFNPCIDCHANMFRFAFYKMVELGAHFAISGEVLGQRPKSQRKDALNQVKKLVSELSNEAIFDSILSRDGSDASKPKSLDELILRPMSAKLLEPSFPEKIGWVDRERLLDVSGRGRSLQLSLVEKYNWKYHEKPGGGCLLTDLGVSSKMKDLQSHRKIVFDDLSILKVGRYLVLKDGARCVVARNEEESKKLSLPHSLMEHISLPDIVGPIALVEKDASKGDKMLACSIVLGYSKAEKDKLYNVKLGGEIYKLSPLPKEEAHKYIFLT